MPMTRTLTTEIHVELDRELSRLAKATLRPNAWLVNLALQSFIESEWKLVETLKTSIGTGPAGSRAPSAATSAAALASNRSTGRNGS